MAQHREAGSLLRLAHQVLAELEDPMPTRSARLAAWERVAYESRELANRVVLNAAVAARRDQTAAERQRLLGELAVWPAVNTEWAVVICNPEGAASVPTPRTGQLHAESDAPDLWESVGEALRHTALGIVRMLEVSHGTATLPNEHL